MKTYIARITHDSQSHKPTTVTVRAPRFSIAISLVIASLRQDQQIRSMKRV